MKKILALCMALAMGVGVTGLAAYSNWNNSYEYDEGYQRGYLHGKNSHYERGMNYSSDYSRGYNDGFNDAQHELHQQEYGY